jgi:hypothetical protein
MHWTIPNGGILMVVAMVVAAVALIVWAASVAFMVWVVLALLKIMTRIAIAVERTPDHESPATVDIPSSR